MKGKTYLAFLEALRSLGYTVEARVLNAADYGDPTSRKRLFILAKKNGPVVFPEPSHGNNSEKNIFSEVRKPWLTARGVIDWNVKGKSIFGRKKPLSLNTIRRITKGLEKYSGLPYLVTLYGKSNATGIDQPMPTITAKGEHIGICEPFLVEYHGSNRTGGERVRSVNEPLPTVDTSNRLGLCEPFIVAVNHGKDDNRSYSMDMPMPTITSVDAWGLVQPFLVKYYGKGGVASVDEPLDTITAKDRFGLVIPVADGYVEVDILYRMLLPHELAAAMSFPSDYKFFGNRGDQVKQIGNAVPGETAKALVMALIGAGRNE
jgi:DNA (cytosine-5)-methyltransferase 1